MERPNPADPDVPTDPVPDDEDTPKPLERRPHAPQVTPLDEDKNLEKGIEIKET
jgi:hypothetical protein